MGQLLYYTLVSCEVAKRVSIITKIPSAAFDISIDTGFEFNNFHEDQKEVGCLSIFHSDKVKVLFRQK